MRLSILLFLAFVLLVACSSSNDDTNPSPTTGLITPTSTVTPTVPAEPTASATPGTSPTAEASTTPDPNGTPPAGDTINAENFATLDLVFDAVVDMPEYMAWQDDGRLLVASRSEASLIDPLEREVTPAYSGAGQEYVLAISERGQIATAKAGNMGIDVRDLTGNITSSIDLPAQFGSVSFSSDGSRLAVARLDEIAVGIWDIADGSLLQEVNGFQTAAPVYSARFGPDDASLIWTSRATVQVTDLGSGELGPPMQHELFVNSVYTPDTGSTLVTTWATFATLWDLQTGQRIQNLDQLVSAFEPALLSDAQLLLIATDEGVKLWDTATFAEIAALDVPARQIEVSDDERYLATLDQDGYLQVLAPPEQ